MAADPRHLVIFARRPAYGVGKRRLAAGVGELEALRFQRRVLEDLQRRLGRDPRWRLWLALTPDRAAAGRDDALPQGSGDLGRRLTRLTRALPRGPMVVIGSDAPDIRVADIAAAFRALGDADAVFGPAIDGGYWLVGLKRGPHPVHPFRDVRWSSPDTLADTLANLRGRPTRLLRSLEDVDDLESFRRHQFGRRR